jgi:hypothetical protein
MLPIVFILQLYFATLETSKNGSSATIAQTFLCAGPLTGHHRWLFTRESPKKHLTPIVC